MKALVTGWLLEPHGISLRTFAFECLPAAEAAAQGLFGQAPIGTPPGRFRPAAADEEEERMLAAFRRFRAIANRDGAVFKWATKRMPGIIAPPEHLLVRDPRDVSQ